DHRDWRRDGRSRRSRDAPRGSERRRCGHGDVPRPTGVATGVRRARRLVRRARRHERRRPHGLAGGSRVTDVRDRLALALDVGGAADAERVARRLAPWFGIAKVGLELYGEAGPDIFERLRALGLAIFADLKLYEIPTTVERAARVLGRRGVDFLNFPAAGGAAMLEAGVTGLAEGARDGGHQPPRALAVTVLTSETDVSAFDARLEAAATAGC